jgi:hypothetical protein
MRRPFAAAALVALVATLPGLVPQATAEHGGWRFGAGIDLGNVHLAIGFVPDRYAPPTYYYRTRDHLRYGGHRCTDRCYRRGADWYHHERCPVVLGVFQHHRLHPHVVFSRHAPGYDGRWARYDPYTGHRDDRYDRHDDRYDRRDRYDRYGRDDRRGGSYGWSDERHDRRGRHDRGRHRGWERGRGHGHHDGDGRHHRH